jgi:hypothetical protein
MPAQAHTHAKGFSPFMLLEVLIQITTQFYKEQRRVQKVYKNSISYYPAMHKILPTLDFEKRRRETPSDAIHHHYSAYVFHVFLSII